MDNVLIVDILIVTFPSIFRVQEDRRVILALLGILEHR